jgi:hypothetical protein
MTTPSREPVDASPFMALFGDPSRRRTYEVRSPAVWMKAQADYAAGHPAPDICKTYDLSLSTFKTRARREGWRRRDLAEEERMEGVRMGDESDLDPPEALPAALLRDMAWRHASEAIRCGRSTEAQRWIRIRRELRMEEHQEAMADLQRSQDEAEMKQGREAEASDSFPPPCGEGIEGWGCGDLQVAVEEREPVEVTPTPPHPALSPQGGEGSAASSDATLHPLHPEMTVQSDGPGPS